MGTPRVLYRTLFLASKNLKGSIWNASAVFHLAAFTLKSSAATARADGFQPDSSSLGNHLNDVINRFSLV